MHTINTFVKENFEQILANWLELLKESWKKEQRQIRQLNLEQHCNSLLRKFIEISEQGNQNENREELARLLTEVGSLWAVKGVSASETSTFIITLKKAIKDQIQTQVDNLDAQVFELCNDVEQQFDELLLICQDAYSLSREKLIKQQSTALLELSSPVVKMWDKIVLLPLIGVIDTARAKQITESLLTEIARLEAVVAVLDLTGVPVFDTAVAGHLIKTVNAAHMLGCQIIMTGISTEGALVLTKLGVEFKDVVTRGNLHSGVKAAFAIRNLSVVKNLDSADAA